MALGRASELESEELEDQEDVIVPLEQTHDLPVEESVDDEICNAKLYEEMELLCESYTAKEASCQGSISM
jgi:hypothetical protein